MYLDDSDADAEILSNMIHDLKTPISAVRGFLELIEASGELNDQQVHFQERAFAGLARMELLINAFLEMNRLKQNSSLALVECSFGTIITESLQLVEPLAAKRNITIHQEIATDLESVMGQPEQLMQVVDNLLSNAIKYNLDGGDVYVTAKNHAGFVQLEVRDTGAGIASDDQLKVFEAFFRTRKIAKTSIEGTGLGLAIVRLIVEKHNGRIWLESEPGVGSAFSVTIPHRPRQGEGHDLQQQEPDSGLREGRDFNHDDFGEFPLERSDAVDDNLQESNDLMDVDSSSDLL